MTRIALITGAAQGIGRELARHFLSRGWRVAGLDVDAEALAELTDLHAGAPLLPLLADVGNEGDVAQAFARLEEWQRLAGEPAGFDLLVNNAGIASPASGPIEALPLTEWNRWLDSHLTGAFLCTRSAVPGLRLRRGSIVNISSTRALQSEPDCEAYAAAKGGLLSLTHALAVSLGPDIRVNAICPGWIETGPLQKKSRRRAPEHREIDLSQHPAGRVGEPADIASLVEYLSGPQAGFITGQHVVADGGMTRRMIYAP